MYELSGTLKKWTLGIFDINSSVVKNFGNQFVMLHFYKINLYQTFLFRYFAQRNEEKRKEEMSHLTFVL